MEKSLSKRQNRFIYIAISTLGLIGILVYMTTISSSYLFNNTGVVRYLSYAISTIGVVVIHQSFKQYSASEFLGISSGTDDLNFKTSGILKYTRHPIYLGTILITIGFFLFSPRVTVLVSNICIYFYLIIGIRLEERKLIAHFGESYIKYRKKVPMLFPKLKFSSTNE